MGLAQIAARDTGFRPIAEFLNNPTTFFHSKNPVEAFRAIKSFPLIPKTNFLVKVAVIEGKMFQGEELQILDNMYPLPEERRKLISFLRTPSMVHVNLLKVAKFKI